MKHIKFTYVDAVTGISVASHPAENGPTFPPVEGLTFAWARESRYPTDVPEFFGTCPDGSNTQIDGVLGVYDQADWENMQADEMRARNPVPQSVTRAQAIGALILAGLDDAVQPAINAIQDPIQRKLAQNDWDNRLTFERDNQTLNALAAAIGMSDADLDQLFIQGAKL